MADNMKERIVNCITPTIIECSATSCAACKYIRDEYQYCKARLIADSFIAKGGILPPCNVGDKVYYLDGKTIVKTVVHCISYGGRHGVNPKGQIHIHDSDKDSITINFDQFGKKLFKTYEEAERKLEEAGETNAD